MPELGRRRHPRYVLGEPLAVRRPASAEEGGGQLLNVSLAGLAFATPFPPADGASLALEIVDRASAVRAALHAHVVATTASADVTVVHCAFIDVDEPERLLDDLGVARSS